MWSPEPRRLRAWVGAATVLALGARLAAALLAPIPPAKDAAEYHALALALAEGRGYVREDGSPTAFRPPGLPFLLAVVYRLGGADPGHGRAALAVAGALVVPPVACLALALAGPAAAVGAAFAAALYPPLVTSWFGPRALLAEPLLATLATLALALGLHARADPGRRGAGAALAAGIVSGAGVLTKATIFFLPALLAAALLGGAGGRGRRLARALLLLGGAALVVAPWAARNRALLGAWVPVSTNGGISVWASYNPRSRGLGNAAEGYGVLRAEDERLRRAGMGEVGRSRHFLELARREIAARPRRAALLVGRKALLFWDPTLKDWSRAEPALAYNWAYGAALPLALLGAGAAGARRETRAAAALLAAFAASFALVHVLLHADVRYRLALEPALLALASAGGAAAAARLGGIGALAAGAAYAGAHALVAWRYGAVFALLQALARALGLG